MTVRMGSRCEESPQFLELDPAFPLYALMDFVVGHYASIVDHLEDRLQALDDTIFHDPLDREAAEAIYELKSGATRLRRRRLQSPRYAVIWSRISPWRATLFTFVSLTRAITRYRRAMRSTPCGKCCRLP
jgi:hypothetical protein